MCDELMSVLSHSLSQIMDETQTQIAWPSKLKIGAKSKKGIFFFHYFFFFVCISYFLHPCLAQGFMAMKGTLVWANQNWIYFCNYQRLMYVVKISLSQNIDPTKIFNTNEYESTYLFIYLLLLIAYLFFIFHY